MLPKNRRISRLEFPHILKTGKRHNSPSLLLYIAKNEKNPDSSTSFSFSVSKKVQSTAVGRNTYRRWGYAAVRPYIHRVNPGFLCFFSFKKGLTKSTFTQIEKEVLELLSASGVVL